MKTMIFLCCTFAFGFTSEMTRAQDAKIAIPETGNFTVEEVFDLIKRQTDYTFVYHSDFFDNSGDIALTKGTVEVGELLTTVLGNRFDHLFSEETHSIIIKRTTTIAVQQTITGVVRDKNGLPLLGVAILIQGTSRGATSDENGNFIIDAKPGDVLRFSYLGFKSKEVTIKDDQPLQIILEEEASELDEVVLVGYGTTSKRFNTGAVSTISSATLEEQTVQNPIQALQARVPGLQITNISGRPGANIEIRIRGINSINSGNSPLFIIDGVPFNSDPMNQFNAVGPPEAGNQSPLNSLNPNDIESISILKDADATAIYGSRGANGVVLITTKRGDGEDRFNVNVNINSGVGDVAKRLSLLDTPAYLAMRQQAFENSNMPPNPGLAPDLLLWSQEQNTDWQEVLLGNTAHYTTANVGFSGGTANNHFSLSGNYSRQTTVYPGDAKNERTGVRATYDYKTADNKFGISFSSIYTYDNNVANGGDFGQFIRTAPNMTPYDENGDINWEPGIFSGYQHPLANLYKKYVNKTDNLITNIVLDYDILPSLNAKVSFGYNFIKLDQFYGTYQGFNPPTGGPKPTAQFGNTERKGIIVEPQLNYHRKLGDGEFRALVGATIQKQSYTGLSIYGSNYGSDELLNSAYSAGDISIWEDSRTDYRYASVFGRLTYNWMQKYVFNVNFRRDGSSRFGTNNKYGNFGSVGAAWVFSEENFLKDNKILNFGKLRVSYGSVGNDQIGDYQYMRAWTSFQYNYGGLDALIPQRLGDSNYSWEKVEKFDVALELGLLKNNILFNVNYYKNRTDNQLVGYPLPMITGFSSVQFNLPAVVDNTGWEFELNTTNIDQQHFKWNTSFNISLPKNKLISFDNLEASGYATDYEIGKSLSLIKGYAFTGLNADTGMPEFEDINGDGAITYTDDRVALGKTIPDFYGGISNSLTYKQWNLSFLWQFVKKEGFGYSFSAIGSQNNLGKEIYENLNSGTPKYPEPVAISYPLWNNYISSTARWGDASYLRLKNVYLTYNLPESVLSHLGIDRCSIYAQGQNLLTITGYDGLDPEVGHLMYTPLIRSFYLGINLSL
ncbi:SusC/RagA family TonB-linked outer membrane protein [Sinomicrobium sp.]